jgi:hypothetical protein
MRGRVLDLRLDQSEFMVAVRRNFHVSLRLLGKVGLPSILSSLPVVVVLLWMITFQTHALPSTGVAVAVDILPSAEGIDFTPTGAFDQTGDDIRMVIGEDTFLVRFLYAGKVVYSGTPGDPPTRRVRHRVWWNALLGSEVGYIRPDASVEEIHFSFPRKFLVKGVPKWVATWEFPFFFSLLFVAVAIKLAFRIE